MELGKMHGQILAARTRIKDHVRKTPLEYSLGLSEMCKANIHIKLESEQITGSFKIRGATNKVCLLYESDKEKLLQNGPIAASTGNHALACIHIMRKLGLEGTIFVPETITASKEQALRRRGMTVVKSGADCVDGETRARKAAEEQDTIFVSPYNDWDVVFGQGTIGMEILEQLPAVDAIFVAVGGGGLISGIAAYMKHAKPSCKIIGCTPSQSKVMYESVRAGKIIFEESGETLSDGTSGGIEEGSLTFELCRQYVDEWVLVDEEEIAYAVFYMIEEHHKIVEGAAGVAIAGCLKVADKYQGQNIAIVACGNNISVDKISSIISQCGT